MSNTRVIADVMDLFMQGEGFLSVREMGRPEWLEETELVVRRHRMTEKGKGLEGILEVEPEASCDIEMTLE